MRRLLLATTAVALLAACNDRELPTDPALRPAASQRSAGAEGTRAGFYFLAPLAPAQAYPGTFDPSLPVDVVVCKGTAWPCAGTEVARYSRAGRGAQSVRVDEMEEHYIANWNTQDAAAGAYRVHVRVGTVGMGRIDVRVAERGEKGGTITRGQTLPIKFRIEEGTIEAELISESGGTLTSSSGSLSMTFPAGAVSGDVVITAEPMSETVSDSRVIPGTYFDFGPDGTKFDVPVTVTMRYDPALLPKGVSPALLRLHTLNHDKGQWELVPGSRVDEGKGQVTGQITHFSHYALLPARFVQVSAGEFHMCALTEAGSAWCWGSNQYGQLGGHGEETCATYEVSHPCSSTAVKVDTEIVFTSLTAGSFHTCGVAASGESYCWGRNNFGQLGNGGRSNSEAPVKAMGTGPYTAVTAGWMHTCARTESGAVDCWGRNAVGQTGPSSSDVCPIPTSTGTQDVPCSLTPLRVANLSGVGKVEAGMQHTCALTEGGSAYCWGWNAFRQLGIGSTAAVVSSPTKVAGGPYQTIAPGALHTCAVASGTGYCWGSNSVVGALGDGSGQTQNAPALVVGSAGWTSIAASEGNNYLTHSCAVASTTGTVLCWGANDRGQLGVETAPETCTFTNASGSYSTTFDCSKTPNPIPTTLAFGSVVTGLSTTCGFTTDGDLYCWGRNDGGQLGNGSLTGSRTPVRVRTSA